MQTESGQVDADGGSFDNWMYGVFPFLLDDSFFVQNQYGNRKSSADFFPEKPTLENFRRLFSDMNFGKYLKNTLIVTIYSMLGVLFNSMGGYAFAKFRFRGKRFLFVLVLSTMMIPAQVTMIPMYLMMNQAGLTDTYTGIVLPGLIGAFAIFLFRQFIETISDDFLEAARIDGAGEWYIFLLIVIPLMKPIVSLQIILTFINGWNSFLWPLIMSNDDIHYTLSVGLALLQSMHPQDFALLMTGAALMILPVIMVYAVFQKQIVKGISLSNYK